MWLDKVKTDMIRLLKYNKYLNQMNTGILKPILGGIFLGSLLFFAAPFIFIVLLLKFIFTPFGMGRMMYHPRFGGHMGYFSGRKFEMADKIRSMSDEEYSSFREKFSGQHHSCHHFTKPQN